MAGFETFDRDIRLATAGLEQAAISAELAKFARSELSGAIARREASPVYARFVNGRLGASEDEVEAPGPILYVFSWWDQIIKVALDYLQQRSPKGPTGRYSKSFIVMVNGRIGTRGQQIQATDEVIVTNRLPYTRKIQVGAMKMSVPPGIFDDARRHLHRHLGRDLVEVRVRFLNLPNPYILKNSQGTRRDRQAGMPLTYPALVMNVLV